MAASWRPLPPGHRRGPSRCGRTWTNHPRIEILPALVDGRSDFTTLTVSRAEEVAGLSYTQPLIEDVNDVPVLAPDIDGVETLEDLAGLPLHVAEGSRYAAKLRRLNERSKAEGGAELDLRFVDARRDDYDLIDLVELAIQSAVSREPAIYVRNIFRYYVSYRLLADLEAEAALASEEFETRKTEEGRRDATREAAKARRGAAALPRRPR
ncbi:type 2 periplasmic-binding domain-containing protein [Limimaricola litoreus]|uniref:Uncharacterized protein n=1 Tax=Limimaricola litoreus TaxID=2955316 RepID=A0A9X2FQ78_9RHOB|nr:hypothetical protein [Limimaricola litoreus]MCP1167950.1 hypothetical protein [Limimaricola litoreus]